MKRCTWCGKEYPAEATVCQVDGHQLAELGHFSRGNRFSQACHRLWKEKPKDVLFWTGLILSALGFMVGKANKFTFMYAALSPSYYQANEARNLLFSKGQLVSTNTGFSALTNILIRAVRKSMPMDSTICNVSYDIPRFTNGSLPSEQFRDIKFTSEFGGGFTVKYGFFNTAIDDSKALNELLWGSILFLSGATISILSWWYGRRAPSKTTPP